MDEKIVEENNNVKEKSNKKFIIGFIIFLILLIILTISAIYFTFKYIDQEAEKRLAQYEEEKSISNYEETMKASAEDKIYAISSYNETYNENSLIIKEVEDYDIHYVEISGLKNTEIQKRINERIQNTAYSFGKKNVYTSISANFSNILSLVFYGDDDEIKTLNVDLVTGDDIPLEKVFVSSAPLNLYLSDALYETLAWDINYDDGNMSKKLNMEYRDTSEYEDKFLMLANKYKKEKDNIKYNISPQGVYIYELASQFTDNNYYSSSYLYIRVIDYIEEIAIYKRYLTERSIFKDDKLGQKGILVLSDNNLYALDYLQRLSYGKLTDNIFIEEVVECFNNEYDQKAVKDYIDKLSKEKKANLQKSIKSTQGVIFQVKYIINTNEEGYYNIYVVSATATCTKEYFNNNIFKDYAKMQYSPMSDAEMKMFSSFNSTDDLKIEDFSKQYFISFDGEFLGNTLEEVEAKLHPIIEQEDETTDTETSENEITDIDTVE